MKLLLTSAGIINESIKKAFSDLVGKDLNQCIIAFIPTAVNVEDDIEWMNEDIESFRRTGAEVIMADIEKLPKQEWLPILEKSDVICLGGGNTYHLLYWVRKSGLQQELDELLKSKVYIGISAGSILPGPDISYNGDLFLEELNDKLKDLSGLNYVPFVVAPHFLSPHFSDTKKENMMELSKKLNYPIYAIDDESAIKVIGNEIEVVSEGKWEKYN